MSFLQNRKLLIGIVVSIGLIILLFATGILQFSFSVQRTDDVSNPPVAITRESPKTQEQPKPKESPKPEKRLAETPTPTRSPSSSAGFLLYSNSKFGISLEYPSNWIKEDGSEAGKFDVGLVAFDPPRGSQYIAIIVEDLRPDPLTLEEYTESMISSAKNQVKDINFLESKSTTFAGNAGYKIIITGESRGVKFRDMMTWTVKNGIAYDFNYRAQPDNYEEFIAVAEKMAASVRIK